MAGLEFALAGEGIRVESTSHATIDKVARIWAPALGFQPKTIKHQIFIDELAGLRVGGVLRPQKTWSGEPLIELQSYLVIETLAARNDVLVMHAACVVFQGRPLMIIGESGSGKSTLTREAIRRGAVYLTDDCLLVDQGLAYGVARSVQFDGRRAQRPVPSFLEDCDLEAFRYQWEGEEYLVPIWSTPFESLESIRAAEASWTVVVSSFGSENSVTTLSALERLRAIHGAAISTGLEYGGEFGFGPTYSLTWNHPSKAFDLLVNEIELLESAK